MSKNLENNNEDFKTTGGFENVTFEVTACDLEVLEITNIKHFNGIPFYLDKTESIYPVVMKTPEGYFLVDGHELLEEAWEEGKEVVRCFVYSFDEHSDVEISLFILGMRTKPLGGSARYAEVIRNVRICKNQLAETNGNLIRHTQGGRRRGQAFNEADKSGTINSILIASTGRGRSSVGDYLAHSDFIDDNTLNLLARGIEGDSNNGNDVVLSVADRGATKAFFRNIHTKKRSSVMNLQGKNVDDQEIVAIISGKVLAAFREDKTGKKVTVFDELAGEKVEKAPKKVKEKESAQKEAGSLAETAGSQHNVTHEEIQHRDADVHESSGVITDEQQESNKPADIITIMPPLPTYIKLLEGQATRLLEIAKSQEHPRQIAEYVESVITSLTAVLTEIKSVVDDYDFSNAA